jgi:hypothetical protein
MEEFLRSNWLSLLVLVVQGLWGWLWWSLDKKFVDAKTYEAHQDKRGKRMGEVEASIAALAHRMDIAEREVKALPTVQGIHGLSVELEKLRGEIQGFRVEISGQRDFMQRTERQITMLFENELKGGRS